MERILITDDRVSTNGNVIASVRLFPLYLSNQLTFGLDLFCMCVGYYHGLQGLKLKVSGQCQHAVGPISILDRGQFSRF